MYARIVQVGLPQSLADYYLKSLAEYYLKVRRREQVARARPVFLARPQHRGSPCLPVCPAQPSLTGCPALPSSEALPDCANTVIAVILSVSAFGVFKYSAMDNARNIVITVLFVTTVVFATLFGVVMDGHDIGQKKCTKTIASQTITSFSSAHPLEQQIAEETRRAVVLCLADAIDSTIGDRIVLPSSMEYENATQVWSKFYRAFPVAVVFASSENTVRGVMTCAHSHAVRVTVRCGGHGNSGNAVETGAITLDIKSLSYVSFANATQTVRVGSGNSAGSAAYQLWIQSGNTMALGIGQKPTVGMSGLTLGGGFGFLTRHSGFLCDSLVGVRAVLSDGTVVEASETQHSDLFWASCGGGGGSFAVVTEFTFRTTNVAGGVVVFHFFMDMRSPGAADLIVAYQELSYNVDSRATANLEVHNGTHMKIAGFFMGAEAELRQAIINADTTRSFPVSGWSFSSMSYVNAILNLSGWHNPSGTAADLLSDFSDHREYMQFKSYMLAEPLNSTTAQMLIDFVQFTASWNVLFEFQSLGGNGSAFSQVGATATAFPHRAARHCLMLRSSASSNLTDGELAFGLMSNFSYTFSARLPGSGAAAYVNHLDYELWNYLNGYYGLNQSATGTNWDATIDRLINVNSAYDNLNILTGKQLF